ncbi:DUF262 domain-containing protein [Micromonospora sp. RB23]
MPRIERARIEQRTPIDLIREVNQGKIRFPQFQRPFRWRATDVVKLFDSLLHGYPIGSLFLLRRPAPAQHLVIGPLTIEAPETDSALWVLDGQQRIVSLVGALTQAQSAIDPRFRVHLDLDSGKFHTVDARRQVPDTWIPVNLLLDNRDLYRWLADNPARLSEHQLSFAEQAGQAIREYPIATYVLPDADYESSIEIFTRLNTRGSQLTVAELTHAARAGSLEDEPDTIAGLRLLTERLGFGSLDSQLLEQCVVVWRGGEAGAPGVHSDLASVDEPVEIPTEVAGPLQEAITFLQTSCAIPHVAVLPYPQVLPVLMRFIRMHGAPAGRAARLLRRWIWRGAVTGIGGKASDLREQLVAAKVPEAVDAAAALLHGVPRVFDFRPDINRINIDDAMGKVNVLGLLSAQPRDPADGEIVDLNSLTSGKFLLRPLLPDSELALAGTIANYLVLPGAEPVRPDQMASAPTAIASSHLIDEQGQHLLAQRDWQGFLSHRAEACKQTILDHVDHLAEWGARDGRAVTDILRSAA